MAISPPYVTLATVLDPAYQAQQIIVLAKRTYEIGSRGICVAAEQLPLNEDTDDEARVDRHVTAPLTEMDHWPMKPRTDIVVRGKVHAAGGFSTTQMAASVTVGAHSKHVHVHGDRRIVASPDGRLYFSPEELFSEMPLTYFRAYGGIDPTVPAPMVKELHELLAAVNPTNYPGAYPRNPAGTGYTVTGDPRIVDGMSLPNFEQPGYHLTPDNIVVRDPALWWQMPMPQGFGWFDPTWYPRCTHAGILPQFPPRDDLAQMGEVRAGLVERGHHAQVAARLPHERLDLRLANGASPGLAVPYLRGNEPVSLVGFSPYGEIRFSLPGERPNVQIHYNRQPLKTTLALHTLMIEPDERRFSLVWGARAPTPRHLPVRLPTIQRPEFDPLEGVDMLVDGVLLPHETVNAFAQPITA